MCLSVNNQKQMAAKIQICGALHTGKSIKPSGILFFIFSLSRRGRLERKAAPGRSRVSFCLKMHDSGFKLSTENGLRCFGGGDGSPSLIALWE